jgi:hypothetical protein
MVTSARYIHHALIAGSIGDTKSIGTFVERGIMRVQIDSHARLPRVPRTLYWGERQITIVEVIDQWYGPGYRYVKVKGYDNNAYILRFDQIRDSWELIMFSSARAPELKTEQHDLARSAQSRQ